MTERTWPNDGVDIGDLDAVCGFILEWYGQSASPGLPLESEVSMPSAVRQVMLTLGGLWDEPDVGLFNVQNEIVHPARYGSDGIQPFFLENQGVTNFGFDPAAPDELFVIGHWRDVAGEPPDRVWRPCDDAIEDVLTHALLTNFMWLDEDERDTIGAHGNALPHEVDSCLWRRCSMDPTAQAWTNSERTWLFVPAVGFGVGK